MNWDSYDAEMRAYEEHYAEHQAYLHNLAIQGEIEAYWAAEREREAAEKQAIEAYFLGFGFDEELL